MVRYGELGIEEKGPAGYGFRVFRFPFGALGDPTPGNCDVRGSSSE